MRKIHRGFIAIAILGGPASLILAHQKLTETLPQEASRAAAATTLVQRAYSLCSQAPQPSRSPRCDDDIQSFDQCAARESDCNPRAVYEVRRELNVSPARPKDQQPTRPL
jgi:hypothetical protein